MTDLKMKELKEQLSRSKELREEHERLLRLRSTLELEMRFLKEEIESHHFKQAPVEEKYKLAEECQAKMIEIDHNLDDLEEWTDEKFHEIKQELVSLILKNHPDQKEVFAAFSDNESRIQNQLVFLMTAEESLHKIISALKKIIAKRKEVKRKGVFSYLFGANPNVMIAMNMHDICEWSEKTLSECPAGITGKKSFDILLEALKGHLEDLSGHCKGHWGFRTIDKVFSPAKDRLEEMFELAVKEREVLELEMRKQKEEISNWIERYST